jgi:hypothetical protein
LTPKNETTPITVAAEVLAVLDTRTLPVGGLRKYQEEISTLVVATS